MIKLIIERAVILASFTLAISIAVWPMWNVAWPEYQLTFTQVVSICLFAVLVVNSDLNKI